MRTVKSSILSFQNYHLNIKARLIIHTQNYKDIQVYFMLQNPENYEAYINEVVSQLSSKDRYFIAYYDPKGYYKSEYRKMIPYFIIYRQESTTKFEDIMKLFVQQHPEFQLSGGMNWELYEGTKISPNITIEEFKKQLRQESVDGKNIFIYLQSEQWIDQAAITAMLKKSNQFNSKTYEAPFIIKPINYYMYIPLTPTSTIDQVKQILQKQIHRVLKAKIDIKNIEILFQKLQKSVIATDKHLTKYNNSSEQKFIVQFKKQVLLKPPPKQNNTFITFQGQGIKKKKFDYDQIKDKKLSNVLEYLILNKQDKKYAAIIEGQLLRYNQSLSKFDKIFRNCSTAVKHIIGYYVNECLAFQHQYNKLVQKGQVSFEKIHVKQKDNIERVRQCDEKLKVRAQKAKQSHFKNVSNVQPILFYTSEVIVQGSDDRRNQTKTNNPIYLVLNTHMRTNSFCDSSIESKQRSWEYKFAAHLYYQQKKITPLTNQTLWRGIKYQRNYIIGQKIHFQQFNSTSISKSQAEKFATQGLFMILNSKYAHPIRQYSFYETQEEALVEPFTTWEVLKKWKLTKATIQSKTQQELLNLDQKTYAEWRAKQKEAKKIDLVVVKELEKPKLPEMKSTVFLWVDDKPGEGKAIWQKVEEIKNTTVMIQLLTTAQLTKWLQQHSEIINEPQIEIVMVTNMTRVQAGKKEEKAGVYAIDAFYKHKPKGTVFVYIGWLQGTLNKLKEHKYAPNKNLIVSSQFKDLAKLMKDKGLQSK